MDWRAWHGIWYGLADMALYIVWPGEHGMVWTGRTWHGISYNLGRHSMMYGMALRAWHGICYGLMGIWYGLADMAWYMVWPGGYNIVYGMAWRVVAWLMI